MFTEGTALEPSLPFGERGQPSFDLHTGHDGRPNVCSRHLKNRSPALNHGASRQEIEEVILTLMVYAGHARATEAIEVAREVFQARGV